MHPEDFSRVVVRALGLVAIVVALVGAYDLLVRPDPFAGTGVLPREFEPLEPVLASLRAHLEAWQLADALVRAALFGVGLYLLFGGNLVVRLLGRGVSPGRPV